MIPFFLPVWRSAALRDAILGILLAWAVLHEPDRGAQPAVPMVKDTQPAWLLLEEHLK